MSITGKVAKIVDDSHLVLNVGEIHGVTKGMKFVIFDEGDEVADPETGESLGKMEIVKGEVIVEHPQERISLAASTEVKEVDQESVVLSARLAKADPAGKHRKERQQLHVKGSDKTGWANVSPVSVGDPVRSVG